MISDKMQKALNEQINKELYSAYLYLGMAAHFQEANLGGFSRWMRLQAQEEREHALKIFDYIHERIGSVKLKAIDLPPIKWYSRKSSSTRRLSPNRSTT
jgi:ferritin